MDEADAIGLRNVLYPKARTSQRQVLNWDTRVASVPASYMDQDPGRVENLPELGSQEAL